MAARTCGHARRLHAAVYAAQQAAAITHARVARTVGRIGAQTAKQVMIQKIREAERDALFNEYHDMLGQMVTGVIQRYDGGAATVLHYAADAQIGGKLAQIGSRLVEGSARKLADER